MEITYEKASLCALNRIFGFEPRISQALISHIGSASDVFRLGAREADMLLGPYSRHKGRIREEAVEKEAVELERLADMGICFVGWGENGYPPLLQECEDAPAGLYVRSATPPEELWRDRRFISIVGTRDLSPYGKEWCERLVKALSDLPKETRPTIVSGLALGTDACAHRSALALGLPTVAAMATGPETIYPARHRALADEMARSSCSALVTDYPPGTAPLAVHFLRRNRIIAGISEATVLVESKIKGGGMMTARMADSYNRTVFALPGRIDDLRSQGCNVLIRNRTAIPITSIADFLKELGIKGRHSRECDHGTSQIDSIYKGLPGDRISQMKDILTMIHKERGMTVEDIAMATGLEYSRTSQLIGMLETDGVITKDLLQRCFINFVKGK